MASLLDLAQARLQGLLDIPTRATRAIVNPTAFSGLLGAPTLPQMQGTAEAAYGLPARQNMSVLDPNQAAYLQGYQQGEPLAYLGAATPFAAPAAVAGAKAVAPKAGMALENYMASQGLLQPLTAYHGSKSLFDKFDKSKIREGIGTDYGYGAYFAEAPATAKEYMGKQGFFYKTEIPDEFIPKMINWSSSEQPEQVNAILKKAGLPTNTRGEDIYFAAIEKTGGSDAQKSGFQKASEYLDSIGIKGITYPQRSYETEAVTKNYVVFDPSNVKFLERNNQPITGLLDTSYRGSHTAPNAKEYGATIDNLDALMPKDVYSSQAIRLYGLMDKTIDSEWYRAVKKAQGNPDAEIEIFRAVPKGVKDINPGDWITTSKTYAKMHGENALDGEYDIVSKKVKAKTLSSEGYPYEFGYNPD